MNKAPSPFSGWPAWLLILIVLIPAGSTSAAFVALLPTMGFVVQRSKKVVQGRYRHKKSTEESRRQAKAAQEYQVER
jgi:hypothetical protein